MGHWGQSRPCPPYFHTCHSHSSAGAPQGSGSPGALHGAAVPPALRVAFPALIHSQHTPSPPVTAWLPSRPGLHGLLEDSHAGASLEICGRARAEREGLGSGQGSGGDGLQRPWLILAAGFACRDPGEKPFERVRDAARSHTKHASQTQVSGGDPGGRLGTFGGGVHFLRSAEV